MPILRSIVVLGVLWAAASGGEGLWAEGEGWAEQRGSAGPDRPPFGSGGACLGSNWGGARGHYAVYRFRLSEPMPDASLHLRYARKHEGDAPFAVRLDGRAIAAKATFPSTGGWGHLRDDEWRYRTIALGDLATGRHELTLTSLADRSNTNLDGFFLASGAFTPPNTRKQIEQAPRLAVLGPPGARPPRIDPVLSIEDFHPMYRDPYYPSDEDLTRLEPRGRRRPLAGRVRGWPHVAAVERNGRRFAVLERDFERWGAIAFVDERGQGRALRRAVGDPRTIREHRPAYPPGFEEALLASQADLLGEKVLSREGDPSFEACAGFLPDVAGYTFLSTEDSADIVIVDTEGRLGTFGNAGGVKALQAAWFDPSDHLPECEPTEARRGLVGGWLPAIDYGFCDRERGVGWEEIAFGRTIAHRKMEVLVQLRIVGRDGAVERKCFRVTSDGAEAVSAETFFGALYDLAVRWDGAIRELKAHHSPDLAEGLAIDVPERRLVDASLASLARAFITYVGATPRYGVGHYGARQHATFPPTTLSMVSACLEWSLMGRARRYLNHYLDKAVKPDGTFDYYGPAVSEYGQMLDLIARFARRTGDRGWLRRRMPQIEAIAGHLLRLRREGLAKHPDGDVRHGLLFGAPEADTRKEVDFHYSGNAWAWRGWTEIGRALAAMGDEAMQRRGNELLAEADALRKDLDASLAKSIVRTTTPPFVPPVAGFDRPFARMTQDRFASYTNYRYWIEMLSAGCLRPEWADAIIDYRRTHGGEMLGTTRFSGHLDDWPYAGYAYGLLLADSAEAAPAAAAGREGGRDRVEHFLLGLYGDLALHRMHGTFTAYEQTAIRGLARRPYVADYCVPAQLVVPLMVKWMLVFEEPDADVLWLCKATPRRWLAPGKPPTPAEAAGLRRPREGGGIAVRRATTRWGLVGFTVTPRDDAVEATIELPRAGFPAELRLRLRLPEGRRIGRVTINGKPHADVDPDGEFIRIVRPQAALLAIRVTPAQ